jgi:hypothetical protein
VPDVDDHSTRPLPGTAHYGDRSLTAWKTHLRQRATGMSRMWAQVINTLLGRIPGPSKAQPDPVAPDPSSCRDGPAEMDKVLG